MYTTTKRERVKALHDINPMGLFAVFARSPKGTKAVFGSIHETAASAYEVARIHAAESAAAGSTDFTYYVVQIQAKVGIEAGKLVDVELR